jgi:hypothetical protein
VNQRLDQGSVQRSARQTGGATPLAIRPDGQAHADLEVRTQQVVLADVHVSDGSLGQGPGEAVPRVQCDGEVLPLRPTKSFK